SQRRVNDTPLRLDLEPEGSGSILKGARRRAGVVVGFVGFVVCVRALPERERPWGAGRPACRTRAVREGWRRGQCDAGRRRVRYSSEIPRLHAVGRDATRRRGPAARTLVD